MMPRTGPSFHRAPYLTGALRDQAYNYIYDNILHQHLASLLPALGRSATTPAARSGLRAFAPVDAYLDAFDRGQPITDRFVGKLPGPSGGEFSPHGDTGLSPHDTRGAKR